MLKGDNIVSQKKDPNDYQYGKACEDHVGNKFKTILELCAYYEIPYSTYQSKKKRGWDLERILTIPARNFTWRTPNRNMGVTKEQKRKYKDYEEIPGSRYELELNKRRKMALREKI